RPRPGRRATGRRCPIPRPVSAERTVLDTRRIRQRWAWCDSTKDWILNQFGGPGILAQWQLLYFFLTNGACRAKDRAGRLPGARDGVSPGGRRHLAAEDGAERPRPIAVVDSI